MYQTNKIKLIALLIITIGMVFSGTPVKTNVASASCDPNSPPGQDIPRSPVIASLDAPTGNYTNPGNIPVVITGDGGYFCEGDGFGWDQVSTPVSYTITNSAGIVVYHGYWNTPICTVPICAPRQINVNQNVDATSWPAGAYTIVAVATTSSVANNAELSDTKSGTFSITRATNPTGPTRKTFLTDLAIVDKPQVSLLSGGSNTLNIYSGTRPVFDWSTSSVADGPSCTADNDNNDNSWKGPKNGPGGGSQPIAQFYTPNVLHYTLFCRGLNGVPSTVQKIIITVNAPTYSCTPSPISDEMYVGSTRTFALHTSSINGYYKPVTFTQQVDTPGSGGDPLTFDYPNNGQIPDADTIAIVSSGPNTVPGMYTITFVGTDGVTCFDVSLNVKPLIAPGPPTLSLQSTAPCGSIKLSWIPSEPIAPGTTFQVWKKYHSNGTWAPIGNEYNIGDTYEYTDTDAKPSDNYYKVVAENGLFTESNILAGVSPKSCAPKLDGSFKKIIDPNSVPSPFDSNRCNTGLPSFENPNGLINKAGDKIYFEICVHNSGGVALNSVKVTENSKFSAYLQQFKYENSAHNCVTSTQGSNNLTSRNPPIYNIGTMQPDDVCSILISAVITNPGGPVSTIYRFYNTADISSDLVSARVSTGKIQFSIGSGVPIRHETAP